VVKEVLKGVEKVEGEERSFKGGEQHKSLGGLGWFLKGGNARGKVLRCMTWATNGGSHPKVGSQEKGKA